jgi:nucleoside-diphosphate-sugar epimerase
MKIFVTGGTGFIGSHFLDQAILGGHTVRALRRKNSYPKIPLKCEPDWIEEPLDEVSTESLEGCDCLVHFASHGVTNPANATWEDCFRWNVTVPLQLWLKADEAGVKRFIICGSCFEYGRSGDRYENIPTTAPLEPTGAYHSSKAAATAAAYGFAIDKKKELVILRPFQVYGEGENENRLWQSLRIAAKSGRDFKMTHGEQIRDFVNVEYVAKKFLEACSRNLNEGDPIIENIGSGSPKSIREFAESIWLEEKAKGNLIIGAIPYRANETMRYVGQCP